MFIIKKILIKIDGVKVRRSRKSAVQPIRCTIYIQINKLQLKITGEWGFSALDAADAPHKVPSQGARHSVMRKVFEKSRLLARRFSSKAEGKVKSYKSVQNLTVRRSVVSVKIIVLSFFRAIAVYLEIKS